MGQSMKWNAKSVDDYTLHKRRLVVACLGLLAEGVVLTGVQLGGPTSGKQLVTAVCAMAVLAYLGYLALREWRLMKAADR